MARRTKAEAEATRESILDAAEAVFLRKGVTLTSLEAIAREAGVTRGAVYWHFRNKFDVVDGMLERIQLPLRELLAEVERCTGRDDPIAVVQDACVHALRELTTNERRQRVYKILIHRCEHIGEINPSVERQRALVHETITALREQFERAHDQGRLRGGLDPTTAATALHCQLIGVISTWLDEREPFDLAQEAEALIDAVLFGLTRR